MHYHLAQVDVAHLQYNLSVWESLEDLKAHTATASHVTHPVMWWIPAGHIPTVDEAVERLDYHRSHGDTEAAFSFSTPYPVPATPTADPVPPPIDLDRRTFATASNTPNGDAGDATRFEYRQQGARVWATYRGGRVRFGSLVAVGDSQGRLDMRYQHVGHDDTFRTGLCLSVPELLPDGRVRLTEEWQWTNGDRSRGRSIVEEVARG